MLFSTVRSYVTVLLCSSCLASAEKNLTLCNAGPIDSNSIGGANGSFCPNTITLKSDGITPDILIIDHGVNIGGLPTFQVASHSGNTSIFEMTYSETRALLNNYMGDGPLPLAAALDTYRINRYNISNSTTITNRLIQGGQRYQKLNLSTAGELTLQNVGVVFQGSTATKPVTQLPGFFECSDEHFNQIWQTGARTLQLTEIPAGSTPEFYQISHQGLYAESQAPQPYSSLASTSLMEYQLDFSVKSVNRGFGYTVLSDTLGSGIYLFVNLANSSISAHVGSTELDSPPIASALLGPNLRIGDWHKVSTFVNVTEIRISIDGESLLNVTQTSKFYGSWGLGASLGQAAYYQNATLKSLDGVTIYESNLTDSSILDDFLVGTNPLPITVDGARRDRIAYAGDVDITVGPTFASTNGSSYLNGTLDLLGSSQLLPGFFVPSLKIQQAPRDAIVPLNQSAFIGYSFNLVTAMAEYHFMTGDTAFANKWAPTVVRMLEYADSQILESGLFNVSAGYGGDWNYYDPPQSGGVAKFNALYAFALQQVLPLLEAANVSQQPYIERLAKLKSAINTHLWNPALNAYQLSTTVSDILAQDANAFAILANIPQGNINASSILSTLANQLFIPAGALPFSNASLAQGFSQRISPYASGYHLRAAFAANDAVTAKYLLSTMWASMANPLNANYTGCFWEVLNVNGEPGLGDITSLCHAWASAPTGELSRNVLGIQATSPGFSQWKIIPQSLGLKWARGRHPTPYGNLDVSWSFDQSGKFAMNVSSPRGTNGTVYMPAPLSSSNPQWVVNGQQVVGSSFSLAGGQIFNLTQVGFSLAQSSSSNYSSPSAWCLAIGLWLFAMM